MNHSFIALGSNLQSPEQQLKQAINSIKLLGQVAAVSSFYQSTAVGPGEQPDYLNAVLLLETNLAPLDLLKALQGIEQQQGRERSVTNAARTLDLDILLYNQQSINLAELTVPHPRMLERNFVIYPLHDIAPDLLLASGKTVGEYQRTLNDAGLKRQAL